MPRIFVITGPSGVGKGTVISELRKRIPELTLAVSATTRPPRITEHDGKQYYFLSDTEFQQKIDEREFVEHADYSGFRYGTLRSELEQAVLAGRPIILEIEVQGARLVRKAIPEAVQIFIAPPHDDALRERLRLRGTDSEETITHRLSVAQQEIAACSEFEHVIVNEVIDTAVDELEKHVRSLINDEMQDTNGDIKR